MRACILLGSGSRQDTPPPRYPHTIIPVHVIRPISLGNLTKTFSNFWGVGVGVQNWQSLQGCLSIQSKLEKHPLTQNYFENTSLLENYSL